MVRISGLTLAILVLIGLANPSHADTHFVGIGVCPPWKNMPNQPCAASVAAMADVARDVFGVPRENISTLVDADATVAGLRGLLAGLPPMGADDRLYLYINLHNGAAISGQNASADNDVMVFWSEENPGIIEFAMAEGLWLPASEVADAVLSLGAGEIVLIMDACESDAVSPLFLHGAQQADSPVRVATLTSAQPGQWANLNETLTMPLFTQFLTEVLQADTGAVTDRIDHAIATTTSVAQRICAARHALEPPEANMTCNQVPILHDPHNLLRATRLGATG